MKVLLINSDVGYGSTGRICSELYQTIITEGKEALLGYGRECTRGNADCIRIGNQFDVYSHVVVTRIFDLQGFGSMIATKKFIEKIEYFAPDIIHLHNIHGSYINIKILFHYIKKIKKPVIWTLHDCWAFTGHCAYYTFAGCSKWEKECQHCIQKNSYPASFFLDHSKRNYHIKKELFQGVENLTIITVSKWLAREVKRSYLSQYEVRVITNGIHLDIFKPTQSNVKKAYNLDDKIVLLGVASIWHDRKGLWLFNDLAGLLDDTYQIVLVGVTEKQRKKLSNKIRTIPRTNNTEELAKIYTAADIFLNPSIEESFGMVSLEALACGTPVITNKYSANPELINDDCGIVVEDITPECFLEAIHRLRVKPKKQENCIVRANNYDKNKCYQAYMNLYQEVIE